MRSLLLFVFLHAISESLEKKDPGYEPFTIEKKNKIQINLNKSNLAVFIFHSTYQHSIDISVSERRKVQQVTSFQGPAILISGDTVILANNQVQPVDVSFWVLSPGVCQNAAMLMFSISEIGFHLIVDQPKEPICIFNVAHGETRTTINSVPTTPKSPVSFFRETDFGGVSSPYICQSGCTFETSQSHFLQVVPGSTSHMEFQVSFSGAMYQSGNLSCESQYIPYMSASEQPNTKTFGANLLGLNCVTGLSGDKTAISASLIIFSSCGLIAAAFFAFKMAYTAEAVDVISAKPAKTGEKGFLIDKAADPSIIQPIIEEQEHTEGTTEGSSAEQR